MINTSELVTMGERVEVLNTFCRRMCDSGYYRDQIRHCIVSGLTTYEKRREKARDSIFRSFETMNQNRNIKQMVLKTTWYLDKPKPDALPSVPTGLRRGKKGGLSKEQMKHQPASVLFAPRTEGGKHLSLLRATETTIGQGRFSKYRRMKIVEDGGTKVKHLISPANPWSKVACTSPY